MRGPYDPHKGDHQNDRLTSGLTTKIDEDAEPFGDVETESEIVETLDALPLTPVAPPTPPAATAQPLKTQERPTLPSPHEREWLRGALSKDMETGFRILVTGDIGPKTVGKLIKFLEAQKALLEDDED